MTFAIRRAWPCLAGVAALLAACASERAGAPPQQVPLDRLVIHKIYGDSVTIGRGAAAAVPLAVRVTDSTGRAVAKVPVYWRTWSGTLVGPDTVADASGIARASWRPDCTLGSILVEAGIDAPEGGKTWFAITGVPGPVTRVSVSGLDDLAPGETAALRAYSHDACGDVYEDRPSWTSTAPDVLRLETPPGSYGPVALAGTPGNALLLATASSGATDTLRVRVHPVARALVRVAIGASGSAGGEFGCALDQEGRVRCWGPAEVQASTRGTDPYARTLAAPARFREITAAWTRVCALDDEGQAWCWGLNAQGDVGDGTTQPRASAVPIGGALRFTSISAGVDHSCAVTIDSAVYCWGVNDAGQLGDGTRTSRSVPALVASSVRFSRVAAGDRYTCGLDEGGQAWCWGEEPRRNYADPPVTHLTPELVEGAPKFRQLALGAQNGCGLTATGEAWCWGSDLNDTGQSLGYGGAPAPVHSSVAFTTLTVGAAHACALDAAGTVYCWGGNRAAQLGSTDVPARRVPAIVSAPAMTRLASAPRAWSTCGVTGDGSAYCWGLVAGAIGRRIEPYPVRCSWGKGASEYPCSPAPRPVLEP